MYFSKSRNLCVMYKCKYYTNHKRINFKYRKFNTNSIIIQFFSLNFYIFTINTLLSLYFNLNILFIIIITN